MNKAFRVLLLFITLSALLLNACGGSTESTTGATAASENAAPVAPPGSLALTRDPKTLVILVTETADNLDPGQTFNVANAIVQRGLYESVLRLKGSDVNATEGLLAESWTTNDDKSQWTFKIRQGITFHDGTVCDAQAIYDSIYRTVANKLPTVGVIGRFLGAEPAQVMKVVDPYTLEFTFAQPQPLFDLSLAAVYGAFIVNAQAAQANEKNGDFGKEWLTTHAIGTGPYKLEKFAPNDEVILVRNPDYWRGWPKENHFEKIILKVVPEATTRRQMLEKGEADISYPFQSPEDQAALAATGMFNIGDAGQLRIDYAAFTINDKLKDPRIRQAISYAFDYDGYINGIKAGIGQQAAGPFPRNLIYHDPNVFVYPTDLEKAKQLFDAAGWSYDETITFMYYPGFGGENVGPILQAQLEQIGVKMEVQERDISSFNGIFYGDQPPNERPDMLWYAWWPNYSDAYDESWILYHSAAAGSAGANAGFYANPRVDALIDAAYGETDPAKLQPMWAEVQKILTVDDPAGLWVEDPLDRTLIRKDIEGQVYNGIYAITFDYWALTRKAQ